MDNGTRQNKADDDGAAPSPTAQRTNLAHGRGEHGSQGQTRVLASTPAQEQAFRNKYLYDLSKDRPAADRIDAIINASRQILPYSQETLAMVWNEVEDMVAKNAKSENRRAALQLISASVSRQDITENESVRFLELIVRSTHEPIDRVDPGLLASLAGFAREQAEHDESVRAEVALNALSQLAALRIGPGESSHYLFFEESSNIASIYLVQNFLKSFSQQPHNTVKSFEQLVRLSNMPNAPTASRLSAMKLLTRIRCNANGLIYIIDHPDTQNIAHELAKTEESARLRSSLQKQSSRASISGGTSIIRTGRTSTVEPSSKGGSRSATQSITTEDLTKASPVLWMYPASSELPGTRSEQPSNSISAFPNATDALHKLNMHTWFESALNVLQDGSNWELYSFVLVHLPSQLMNISLFEANIPFVRALLEFLIFSLRKGSINEPPTNFGLKKGDVALCLFHLMTVLIGYHIWFAPEELINMVHTFLTGISMWDRAAKCCIHALTICCHEIPRAVDKCLSLILTKMSQIISQSYLAMDILEFLGQLARLPDAYRSIGEDPIRTIFGICISHLHQSREQRQIFLTTPDARAANTSNRTLGISAEPAPASESSQLPGIQREASEYVYALAYTVITTWFLAISLQERPKHVGWIAKNLAWKDKQGAEIVEEQSQVTLDMMHRTAFLDLGETVPRSVPANEANNMLKKTWLMGMSIVTMETDATTGLTQITKRQASGTTYAVYQPHTAPLPSHHVDTHNREIVEGTGAPLNILPNHVLLQLSSTISPMPIPTQPIVLPDDDFSKRAISTFDRINTVDGHKAGIIYLGKDQAAEAQILANTSGSESYEKFLSGLGTKVSLRGASFNAQGLDREYDTDGTHTYAWRDRITELVFHIPTMMPTNLQHDEKCVNKKRHIGNDFVNVIYNESGLPFKFDTFASQLNYVNIVITPEEVDTARLQPSTTAAFKADKTSVASPRGDAGLPPERTYFKVQLLCAPSFPQISPAATTKLLSEGALPSFVRQLVLNASVFSMIWSNREGGEYISSWRSRLREIRKLRERYSNTATSANVAYPGMGTPQDRGGARSYVEGDDWRGTLAMGGLAEHSQFLMSLDFTRWA
ncbi:MAG: hypothetical protein Q9190_004394 [Brigantiaea leucoxantha]